MMDFRLKERTSTWPGFVDLFSNLVIILIFLLIVFVFLWTTTSVFNVKTGAKTVADLKATAAAQEEALAQMETDMQEAKRLLIVARGELDDSGQTIAAQEMSLNDLAVGFNNLIEKTKADMQAQMDEKQKQIDELTALLAQSENDKRQTADLEQERRKLQDEMSAQQATMAEKLTTLQNALDAAEEKSRTQQVQYMELSDKLNRALADKVAELQGATKYQSAFYKATKIALGDNKAFETDGDRFIISSDILFKSGEYTLSADGKKQLRQIANVIRDLENVIPTDIDWIIRVDGHTDKRPVIPGTRAYWNNTQLSMLRAVAVVDELVRDGVSRRRLLPTGFGEMYPAELGNSPAILQKNRRIELQLTNR